MRYPYSVIVLVAVVTIASGHGLLDSVADANVVDRAITFFDKCGDQSIVLCLKESALRFIDTVSGDVRISDGITFVQTSENSRSLPAYDKTKLPIQPEDRERAVNTMLLERITRFLGSHSLQIRVPDTEINEVKRSMEESRKKKKKFLLPLMLLLTTKAATLIPLTLGTLALLAFKSLIIGKIALLLSGVIALKKLIDGKHHSSHYEVVSHPHHSYSSSYSDEHVHFKRSLSTDAQEMAYGGHVVT